MNRIAVIRKRSVKTAEIHGTKGNSGDTDRKIEGKRKVLHAISNLTIRVRTVFRASRIFVAKISSTNYY